MKQGICPECKNELGYEEREPTHDGDDQGYYCYCIDEQCGWTGIEWYTLSFSNFTKTN